MFNLLLHCSPVSLKRSTRVIRLQEVGCIAYRVPVYGSHEPTCRRRACLRHAKDSTARRDGTPSSIESQTLKRVSGLGSSRCVWSRDLTPGHLLATSEVMYFGMQLITMSAFFASVKRRRPTMQDQLPEDQGSQADSDQQCQRRCGKHQPCLLAYLQGRLLPGPGT